MRSPSTVARKNTPPSIVDLKKVLINQPIDTALKLSLQIIKQISEHYDWIGIYLIKGNNLILADYLGEGETEHVQIPIGQGICGLAAKREETIIVPDVNEDPRYLMCFPSTRSEIVVPIRGDAGILGEIDIDSDQVSAFTQTDQQILEEAAAMIGHYLEKNASKVGLSEKVSV